MSTKGSPELIAKAKSLGVMIATAESCTGGLIGAALTDVAGSSSVFDRGFITYSNEAKAEMLGVPMALIEKNGAVSEPVAQAMAQGAVKRSRADMAVAVTGIAGPGGGSEEKPVGLVFIAVHRTGFETQVAKCLFAKDGAKTREDVRAMTVQRAISMMQTALDAQT